MGARASRPKSIVSARMARNGFFHHRVQVIGRQQARHEIHGDVHGRGVQRPAAEEHVERPAPEGAESEPPRRRGAKNSGAPRARPQRRLRMTIDQHRGVHRAADVPEMPSIPSHGSSSRRSNTPHVKAPWEPRLAARKSTRMGARLKGSVSAAVLIILVHNLIKSSRYTRTPRDRRCEYAVSCVVSPAGRFRLAYSRTARRYY